MLLQGIGIQLANIPSRRAGASIKLVAVSGEGLGGWLAGWMVGKRKAAAAHSKKRTTWRMEEPSRTADVIIGEATYIDGRDRKGDLAYGPKRERQRDGVGKRQRGLKEKRKWRST